jgi:hypothetical protein
VGGGNATDWSELLIRCVGFALGLPVVAAFDAGDPAGVLLAAVYLALAAGIALLGVRLSLRKGDDEWILMGFAVLLAPGFVLLLMRPEVVAVRYFLIGIAFYLLLAARATADLYRAGGWRRAGCIAAVALFLAGNAAHYVPFARLGRGGYSEALRFMVDSSPAPQVSVGGDHDFRNGMVLRFYARTLPGDRRLIYHERGHWPRNGPEWLVRHAGRRPEKPSPAIVDENGNRYEFARGFDHAAISGFWWGVYRNVSRAPAAGSADGASRRRSTTTPNPRP